MIQGVIARLANASVWIKRLAIIVVGGAAALAIRSSPIAYALPAMLTVIFGAMDARYLQQERWFRALFDMVRNESPADRPDFRMNPSEAIRSQFGFWDSVFSWSVGPYYLLLTISLLVAWIYSP